MVDSWAIAYASNSGLLKIETISYIQFVSLVYAWIPSICPSVPSAVIKDNGWMNILSDNLDVAGPIFKCNINGITVPVSFCDLTSFTQHYVLRIYPRRAELWFIDFHWCVSWHTPPFSNWRRRKWQNSRDVWGSRWICPVSSPQLCQAWGLWAQQTASPLVFKPLLEGKPTQPLLCAQPRCHILVLNWFSYPQNAWGTRRKMITLEKPLF